MAYYFSAYRGTFYGRTQSIFAKYLRSKIEVLRDVRNSKGPYTWQVQERRASTLEQMQVPNWVRPGVQRSKCPLFASYTRCKCFIETSRNKVITSKTVIRLSSVTRSRCSEMSDQWRVSLYMIMSQNSIQHLGKGDFIMIYEILVSTIELPYGRFQTYPDISLPEKLTWKSRRSQN